MVVSESIEIFESALEDAKRFFGGTNYQAADKEMKSMAIGGRWINRSHVLKGYIDLSPHPLPLL